MANPEQTIEAGTVLNERYRIDAVLGSGGFGEVLAAEDLLEGRSVAVKVLHDGAAQADPRAALRMRQEAEILKAIRHPNIVQVLEVGSFSGGQFLVMERVDGAGLDEIFSREGTLAPDRLLPLVRQLLQALSVAHARDVLHRDLKPENILVSESDGRESIKLVDFGVAKAGASLTSDDPDDAITLVKTRVGSFVGTPRYAAPEMVVGDPAGPPADLFCVGLVVYEALAGAPLIKGTTHSEVISALVFPRPFDLAGLPPDWSRWLEPVLEKAPERRVQSALEALRNLDEIFGPSFDDDDVDIAETAQWEPLQLDEAVLRERSHTSAPPRQMMSPGPPPRRDPRTLEEVGKPRKGAEPALMAAIFVLLGIVAYLAYLVFFQ